MSTTTTPAGSPDVVSLDPVTPLLIDTHLPHFDVTLLEHRVVEADQMTTWAALTALDLLEVHSPLMDAAFRLRALPDAARGLLGRPTGATAPEPTPPKEIILGGEDGGGMPGWLSLGEVRGSEIVLGAVGRFWTPVIEWYDVTGMTHGEFADFDEPGWGRIAAGFSLRPYGTERTLVTYEARTATADEDAARAFARYWRLIRPFVGHIMQATLKQLARDAEALAEHRTPA